jgi:predicted nucleic-acid-binding protein
VLAIDTNVIVRLVTNDDVVQSSKAKQLFEAEQIFVSTTVLLETEWVLRSAYKLRRQQIIVILRRLVGLPNVELEAPERCAQALAWAEGGLDLADSFHLAAARDADGFITFDRQLLKSAAARVRAPLVREP